MERLEGSREAVQERGAAVDGVGEGVQGGDEEVEGYAPVAKNFSVALVPYH